MKIILVVLALFYLLGIVTNILVLVYIAIKDKDFKWGYLLTATIPYIYLIPCKSR